MLKLKPGEALRNIIQETSKWGLKQLIVFSALFSATIFLVTLSVVGFKRDLDFQERQRTSNEVGYKVAAVKDLLKGAEELDVSTDKYWLVADEIQKKGDSEDLKDVHLADAMAKELKQAVNYELKVKAKGLVNDRDSALKKVAERLLRADELSINVEEERGMYNQLKDEVNLAKYSDVIYRAEDLARDLSMMVEDEEEKL